MQTSVYFTVQLKTFFVDGLRLTFNIFVNALLPLLIHSSCDSVKRSPNPAWNHRMGFVGVALPVFYKMCMFSPQTQQPLLQSFIPVWSSVTKRWVISSPKLWALLAQISKAIIYKITGVLISGWEWNVFLYFPVLWVYLAQQRYVLLKLC